MLNFDASVMLYSGAFGGVWSGAPGVDGFARTRSISMRICWVEFWLDVGRRCSQF